MMFNKGKSARNRVRMRREDKLMPVADHVRVENRNSDVTLFVFAGAAQKVGMMQPYEFRYLFRIHQNDYNLAFFRDIHRSWYQLTPKGSPGGLDFYAESVTSVKEDLGATYNVAIGTSMGASAALYFAARCGMDQVIGFSPGFTVPPLRSWMIVLRRWGNLLALVRSPSGYLWSALLAPVGVALYRRLARVVGPENVSTMLDDYQQGKMPPKATIYYSRKCNSDVWMVNFLSQSPNMQLIGLPTPSHNSAQYLLDRDTLFSTLVEHIEQGRSTSIKQGASQA